MIGRFNVTQCVTLLVCVSVLLAFSGLIKALGQQNSEGGWREKDLVERLVQYPSVPTRFENPTRAPLIIQDAEMKVLTRAEYERLTGVTGAGSEYYATYPRVIVTNTSGRSVITFAMILTNLRGEKDRKERFIRIAFSPKTPLKPGVSWTVVSGDWIESIRWQASTIPGSIPTPLDEGPPEWWLPAGAEHLFLKVALVSFEDGSTWTNPTLE